MGSARTPSLIALVAIACTAPPHATAPPLPPPDAAPVAGARDTPPPPSSSLIPPGLRLPDDVAPTAYRVRFELDPDAPSFRGHVDIDVAITRATDHVWLNAVGLALTDLRYTAGAAPQPLIALPQRTADVVGFGFGRTLAPGRVTLHLDFAGALATSDLIGLFRQQDDGRWYLYSQLESHFARTVVPSFDEPRWKTPWTVTIVAPRRHLAFSNAPIARTTARGDRTETEFAPTPPMPAYLLALAVGPFETVDAGRVGRNHVPARIIVPAGHADEAAVAAAQTGRIVDALEAYFDMPLPLAKLDQVAVPQFFGAMENPGLITYASELLLADRAHATGEFTRAYVAVAAHELAHQWFGDLVTLAWWDDLWLNESFATWMADKVGIALDPGWDPAIRVIDETQKAMLADAAPDALPLRRAIRDVDEIESSFDAIAYEKGGAVLSMFERWIGPDKFRAGVRAYLAAHAGGTATARDFQAALAAIAAPEVQGAFEQFLVQPGVPLVDVGLRCGRDQVPVVTLRQTRLLSSGPTSSIDTPWAIPVCVRWLRDGLTASMPERCALLTRATGELRLGEPGDPAIDRGACPTLVANAGAAGYYRVRYERATAARLLAALRLATAAERAGLASDTGALVDAGAAELGDALALAQALLASGDLHDQLAATELLAGTQRLVDDAHLPAWRAWIARTVRPRVGAIALTARGREPALGGRVRRDLLDLLGVAAAEPTLGRAARHLTDAWMSGKRTIAPDDLELVLRIAATSGDAGLFARMRGAARRAGDPDERGALVAALGGFRDPALVARALGAFADGSIALDDGDDLLAAAFARPETRGAAWRYLRGHFDAVIARVPPFARGAVARVVAGFCDRGLRRDADAFLRPRVAGFGEGGHVLDSALAEADRCIAARVHHAAAVARAFAR
ncbi:MAG: M1 family metallopeptidase [Deltaproteobacteria bacterium]|nr:M1 family metallopeptidase [Deltaproteobacteria bacterium]